ncbi:MAG TPA: hypothetical protein DF712_09295 [Balneola sp.]|jgi:hypothetical protein|nr:hypothetical protein [Bacteroidota bacterium]HCI71158.1 hypothetical protein [Balneola sp.]HCT52641.1 hypothetical protein [Balneola sp.]|tara:strand:- start:135 stop:608 length:474 start_codon:yes stop_codon:yes gene_type:complete
MKTIFSLITIFLILASWNNLHAQETNELELSVIKEIPRDFDGCLGMYAYSIEDVTNEQYILLDGWNGLESELNNYFSYLKINQKLERLVLTERLIDESDSRNKTKKYENESYSVILYQKYLKPYGYDSYLSEISLELRDKNNEDNILTIKLTGYVGC